MHTLCSENPSSWTSATHRKHAAGVCSRPGPAAADGDPCPCGTGERSNDGGECITRVGEVLRRLRKCGTQQVPQESDWNKRAVARRHRDGIAQPMYLGILAANSGQSGRAMLLACRSVRRVKRFSI